MQSKRERKRKRIIQRKSNRLREWNKEIRGGKIKTPEEGKRENITLSEISVQRRYKKIKKIKNKKIKNKKKIMTN